jgi:hypothetical protein
MYKLYTDKPETFECDIKIEGASLTKSKARLVVETKDYSLMFNGRIDDNGKCKVPIKKLRGLIDESIKGNIRLEVIAEDTYFTPWESDFEVQASKSVTVEVRSQDTKPQLNETVKVSNVKQNEPTAKVEQVKQRDVNHVVNILKLLVHENININNLSIKRDKVNRLIARYENYFPITQSEKPKVIEGILKKLPKK